MEMHIAEGPHTAFEPTMICSGRDEEPAKTLQGEPYFTDKFNLIFLFGGYSAMHKLGFKSH